MRPRREDPIAPAREVAERGVRAAIELARACSRAHEGEVLSDPNAVARAEAAAVRRLAAQLMEALGLPRSRARRSQRREEAARRHLAEVLNEAFAQEPYVQPGTFGARLSSVAESCPRPRAALQAKFGLEGRRLDP